MASHFKDYENCPRNLYNSIKNYLSEMLAFISIKNRYRLDITVNEGCPQGSCFGPGYCYIEYSSLMNLNFAKWTRAKLQNYKTVQRKEIEFQRSKIQIYTAIKKTQRKENNISLSTIVLIRWTR